MLSKTLGVADAVNAIIGALGKFFLRSLIALNAGLKSLPHSETQCASSTAIPSIFRLLICIKKDSFKMCSGEE